MLWPISCPTTVDRLWPMVPQLELFVMKMAVGVPIPRMLSVRLTKETEILAPLETRWKLRLVFASQSANAVSMTLFTAGTLKPPVLAPAVDTLYVTIGPLCQ